MTRRRRQGFTLVEVMVAISIMTVGAMAVLAMQQQLIRANKHARDLTTATQIAQNWIERLKLDALTWNVVGQPPGTTTYLRLVGAPGAIGAFTKIEPSIATRGTQSAVLSGAYDFYGTPIDTNSGTSDSLYFCTSFRLSWIYANMRAIRADVRVFWPIAGVGVITTDFPRCADDNLALNPGGLLIDRYHVVYLSTVIKANYP